MTNFNFFFWLFLFPAFLFGKDSWASKTPSTSVEPLPFLNADFFADSLSEAYTMEEDPMGSQRLLQVRNSALSPSLNLSSSFNYSSNPEKVAEPTKNDGTSLNLSLSFNLGIGEYGIGENVVLAPAINFVQMRTFTDPVHDFGNDMTVYDLDTQIASLNLPFVLPDDFSLVLSHAYVVPSTFRGKKQQISYSNTPSLLLTKNFLLDSGDTITFSAGVSYTFSQGDTLEQQINDPVYFNFIEAVMQNSGVSAISDYPSNLQDGISHTLSFAYTKPIGEALTLMPSLSYQSTSFTKGSNTSRVDRVYNAGLSVSHAFAEWLNLSGMANYSWKRTNDVNTPEFEDFMGGLTLSVNHSF
ncbi:hypothetical protein N9J83_04170 [Opitutales bacterium]|nr:hypothetical protein [Opitutales bacterium]